MQTKCWVQRRFRERSYRSQKDRDWNFAKDSTRAKETPMSSWPPFIRKMGFRSDVFLFLYIFLNESPREKKRVRARLMSSAPSRGKIVPGPSAAANYFLQKIVIKRAGEKGGNARGRRRSRDRRAKSDRSGVNSNKIVLTTKRDRSDTLLFKSIICHYCNEITVNSVRCKSIPFSPFHRCMQ